MSARRHAGAMPTARPRGAASLIVVMMLFFLVSLVAAYSGRNLIFEQRTSVNQFRAVQGFEAADAGVEWALAMLNGGRITDACVEGVAATAQTSFRQRYLNINPATGVVTPRTTAAGAVLTPSCVFDGTNWVCSCPDNGPPALTLPAGGGVYPAFRIRFVTTNVVRPGVIGIESQGCTRLADACLNFPATAVESEGRALVTAFVALKPSVATPPSAALTVLGTVAAGAVVNAYNTEADRGGLALHVGNPGGATIDTAGFVLRGPPGTPADAVRVLTDSSLTDMTAAPDRVLPTLLGAWPDVYRQQPAALLFDCPLSGCRAALADLVARHPGRVVRVEGPLTLESAGDVGSLPDPANPLLAGPVMLLVSGPVRFTTPGAGAIVRVFGMVYSQDGAWQGPGQIQGAAFIEGNLGAGAAPAVNITVNMVGTVMDFMRFQSGSFVRLPGSWRDFE